MRLIVVRHGETTSNMEGRYSGQTDVPLSSLGERQILLLGKHLATTQLDVVVSSNLQRCLATARAIAHHHSLSVQEDPDLREISMGIWEGQPVAAVHEREGELVARWRAGSSTCGPEGGETFVQLHERVIRALDRWYTGYPDATVVWVTHGGFIGILICHLLDIDISRRRQFRRDNASINEFLLAERKLVRIVRLNETAFLHV